MKVLVVKDSALMRRQLREILAAAGCEVAIARDGRDALVMAERLGHLP